MAFNTLGSMVDREFRNELNRMLQELYTGQKTIGEVKKEFHDFLNGTAVISRAMLEKKIISTQYIGDGAVYGIKVAQKTLGGEHLRDGSLIPENFSEKLIKRWMLEEKIISTQYIGDGAVYGSKIADKTITTSNLGDSSVRNENIGPRSVTRDKLSYDILDSLIELSNAINNTNRTIDDLVLESGNSDMEVVQARADYSTLNERLNIERNGYLDNFKGVGDITTNNKGIQHQLNTKGTLVILDDDTRKQSYDTLYQWAKANNVPITLAANSSHIMDRESNRINIEEFLEMKDDPLVEFVNHTHTHARLTELNEKEIREEIRLCEEFLNSHGIYTKHLVYPFGAVNDDIKRIATDYVYSSSKSSGRIVNPSDKILDSMQIDRIVFETEMSVFRNKIAEAASVGGCVLINSHSQYDTFDTVKLGQIVDEAKAAGLDVVHYSEAFRRFGNIVELRNEDGSLKDGISAGGYVEGVFKKDVNNFTYALSGDIDVNTDPSAYPVNKVTGMNITSAKATASGFPSAGRLYTSQSGPDDYTFQLFHPINTDVVMKRHWNNSNKVWSTFKTIVGDGKKSQHVRGPYTIPPKGVQNIIIEDEVVKRGDVVAYTLNTVLNNNVTMSGPFIEINGQIRFRLYNISDEEWTIPEFEIYTKII